MNQILSQKDRFQWTYCIQISMKKWTKNIINQINFHSISPEMIQLRSDNIKLSSNKSFFFRWIGFINLVNPIMWKLNSNSIKSINVWLICHMMRTFINHLQSRKIIMNQSIHLDSHSVNSLSSRWWDLRNIWDEVKINLPLWSLLVLLLVLSSFLSSLIPMTD